MLPDNTIAAIIGSQIPELTLTLQTLRKPALYKIIHAFTDYTSSMIATKNWAEVKKCCAFAGVLYRNGSQGLRNAIENVYVYGLSPILPTQRQAPGVLLPASLQTLRMQQLRAATI